MLVSQLGRLLDLHYLLALTHLDSKDLYLRILFMDFNSAFNMIIPQQLTQKLDRLGVNTSLCNWLDFLTGRLQAVRVGSNTFSTITLNMVPPHPPKTCAQPPALHPADP